VCPERRCGMPAPRPRVEILHGRLMDEFGKDVDALYRRGVADTLADLGDEPIDMAILQPRSPTCGVYQVYDGTFSGVRVEGQGALAQALAERGILLKEPQEL